MEEIYLKIIEAFEAKKQWFTNAGLKPPKFVDFYFGQPDDPEQFEFVLPALFVDYSSTWTKEGRVYAGQTTLNFHAIPELAPTASNISARQSAGLKIITWYRLVRQVLDTVTGENFADLLRGTESPAYTRDFKYHIMSYSTVMAEESGKEVGRFGEGKIEDIDITGVIVRPEFTL